jgi:hypothetical protein
MEAVQTPRKPLKLFHIENPLTVWLGAEFFRSLPSVPGVYFFYGREGELLYIGQSLDLRARIVSLVFISCLLIIAKYVFISLENLSVAIYINQRV